MAKGTPSFYFEDATTIEYGVDEVARGCVFGRVYASCVVWKHPDDLRGLNKSDMPHLPKGIVIRDSKTMSRPQRERAYKWILDNAYCTSITYKNASYIDEHNILQAAHDAMGSAIEDTQHKLKIRNIDENIVHHVLVDGNTFRPQHSIHIGHTCVVKGDSTYFSIACAAILAKVAHDRYICNLCKAIPELHNQYDLLNNMGYGTKKHIDGIRTYGVSTFHRKSFKCCIDQRKNVLLENHHT